MRVLVCPDKFKGSLTAREAAEAIARGVRAALPSCEVDLLPLADGGEGTLDVLVGVTRGCIETARVTGPLGQGVDARWGMLPRGRAVIEMAEASGLALVPVRERDPSRTTTFGTGELIRAALDAGAVEIVVALGGSATNDAGAGMLEALGARLLESDGRVVGRGGGALGRLGSLDCSMLDPRLRGVRLLGACDVRNPLLGPRGATRVF